MTEHQFHQGTRHILEVVAMALTIIKNESPEDWRKLNQSGIGLSDALYDIQASISLINKEENN